MGKRTKLDDRITFGEAADILIVALMSLGIANNLIFLMARCGQVLPSGAANSVSLQALDGVVGRGHPMVTWAVSGLTS